MLLNYFKAFLALLTFILLYGCETENPGEPKANEPPDTYISEASAGNITQISFYGTDTDGFVDKFQYQWADDDVWDETDQRTLLFTDIFSSETDIIVFYVKGIDNRGLEDPTPAELTITPTNTLPETEITGGPEFGAKTGEDVFFTFTGQDKEEGGSIVKFEYTMDNLDTWHETPVDLARAAFLGLSTGAHVFYVRAIDNLGGKDLSPAQVAFIVEGGKFSPDIVLNSQVSDGGEWFAGLELAISWEISAIDYYGSIPAAPYSFAFDDSTNFNSDPIKALSSGWTSSNSSSFIPETGAHIFYLKVRDTAGGISLERVEFNAESPSLDSGILVVNGVSPGTYGSTITDRIAESVYWGSLEVDFWDLFGDESSTHPNIILPESAEYVGGGGPVPAAVLGKYSSVVWLGNMWAGDYGFWLNSPALPYLKSGGNLILFTRFTRDFMDENQSGYANIGWRGDGAYTIQECKAVFPGLIDMIPENASHTHVFSAHVFLNSLDDNTVTNWDGSYGYTKPDLTTTLLFAHRSDKYNTDYPFSWVRGLGVWSHPNFPFSSTSAGNEFPTPGTMESQGNFIVITARNYSFDMTSTKANLEFMLINMCGEQ